MFRRGFIRNSTHCFHSQASTRQASILQASMRQATISRGTFSRVFRGVAVGCTVPFMLSITDNHHVTYCSEAPEKKQGELTEVWDGIVESCDKYWPGLKPVLKDLPSAVGKIPDGSGRVIGYTAILGLVPALLKTHCEDHKRNDAEARKLVDDLRQLLEDLKNSSGKQLEQLHIQLPHELDYVHDHFTRSLKNSQKWEGRFRNGTIAGIGTVVVLGAALASAAVDPTLQLPYFIASTSGVLSWGSGTGWYFSHQDSRTYEDLLIRVNSLKKITDRLIESELGNNK